MWPISARFASQLKAPVHSFRVKMQVLDTDFNVVREFTDTGALDTPDNYLVDGSVDLDITRATRRTFTASLLNPDGQFSPGSDWAGLFYVNRLVRFYRGVSYGVDSELVPIGTFMIDHADVIVERNMSMVVLSGSDLWKKLAKSSFTAVSRSWDAGESLVSVIKDMADNAGVTRFVDDVSDDRTGDSATLNKKFSVERGDNRGDAILKLAQAYGLDVAFDPYGRLAIVDFRAPEDTRVVWTLDPDDSRMLLSLRSSYTDDALYNHAFVIGTGNKNDTVIAHMRDEDPTSVTSIDRIGERINKLETDLISTHEAAAKAAKKLFYKNILLTENISLDAICNPALDGNDVIRLREPQFARIDKTYRIRGLTIPFASARQTLKLTRAINLGTIVTNASDGSVVGAFVSDAYIKRAGITGAVLADAYIKSLGISHTFTADAELWTAGDTYRAVVLADSPLAYFRLGEASGTTMADETGNHDGSYVGTPTLGAAGATTDNDTAMTLDGSGSGYGEVSAWTTMPAVPVTIEAWVRHNGDFGITSTGVTIAGWSNVSESAALMAFPSDADTLEIGLYTDIGNTHYLWTPGDTNWHHLVAMIKADNSLWLYLDGADVGTSGTTTYDGGAGAEPFRIGSGDDDGTAGAESWPGDIDEVAVYGTELSATQIAAHYAAASEDQSRPFAAPVTTGTFTIPGTVDDTGATDASADINAWIESTVPDGSIIEFATGATYRLEDGILLAGRNNIVLKGNGCTLLQRGSAGDETDSTFLLRGSNHISIDNFIVDGVDPGWPTNAGEGSHVLGISGFFAVDPSSYVEMSNVTATHVYCDGVYIEGRNADPWEPSNNIWVHDCSFDYMGRNAVSFINCTDVLVENCTFDHMSMHAFDYEPNFDTQQVRRTQVRNCSIGSYGHRSGVLGFFVADIAIETGLGAMVSDVTIADNVVTGNPSNGVDGTPRALQCKFVSTNGVRQQNISILRNTTSLPVAASFGSGGVFYFDSVDTILIDGNTQPLTSGVLTRFDNCTGVTDNDG